MVNRSLRISPTVLGNMKHVLSAERKRARPPYAFITVCVRVRVRVCMRVYECSCCLHATGSHFMWFPIVRVQDWRAPCHPAWPSQIRMSFVFTSCLQNVAWCCLICGMCLLLIHPFVGGSAEPGEGVCPAQSGRV